LVSHISRPIANELRTARCVKCHVEVAHEDYRPEGSPKVYPDGGPHRISRAG